MKYADMFSTNMLVGALLGAVIYGAFKVVIYIKGNKAKKKMKQKSISTICKVNELEATTRNVERENQ